MRHLTRFIPIALSTFILTVALLAGSGCAATNAAIHSAAGTVASATTATGVTGQVGQLQVLTGNLDADLFRALMSIRAGLMQFSVAAAGDPALTVIANNQIARFNSAAAEIVHFRALFGVVNAAVSEGVSLQGQPVDWTQLTPIGPVGTAPPVSPATSPSPSAPAPKPPGR